MACARPEFPSSDRRLSPRPDTAVMLSGLSNDAATRHAPQLVTRRSPEWGACKGEEQREGDVMLPAGADVSSVSVVCCRGVPRRFG